MLELDGSVGGGQLIRTALSLSAVSGEPFRMVGIRGGRPNPGLRPQHLAAVRAIAEVTGGDVSGATVESGELEFEPGRVRPGRYSVDVGTAGSLPLLFDALLPLAHGIGGPLALDATGGTDVEWSPRLDYFRRVKLPLLRRHGVAVAVDLDRRGFYPAGGGRATLSLSRSAVDPLDFVSPGGLTGVRVYSVASEGLADRDVAERQAEAAADGLAELDVDVTQRVVEYASASSPGSALTLRLDYEGSIAGSDALGERGRPAEDVAGEAVEDALETRTSGAAVDVHLADQLLVFLALAGGRVTVPRLTDHVETNLAVLDAFGYDVSVDRTDGVVLLSA